MEALIKLRKVVPSGVRYLCVRSVNSKTGGGKCTPVDSQDSLLPFSRSGDCGNTLAQKILLPKNHRIFDAIGDTDELLCQLGVARENAIIHKHPYSDKLTRIQTMLVDIMLAISKKEKVVFSAQNTKELEEWIVDYSKDLTPAENYLLPGGGKVSLSLHVARSVCRRAERSVFPLVEDGQLDQEVQTYFNRLADLLFTWARYAAKRDERSESVYTPKFETKKKLPERNQETTESDNKNPS